MYKLIRRAVVLAFVLVPLSLAACVSVDRSKPGNPENNWIVGTYQGTASSGWKQCWKFEGVYDTDKVVGTMDRSRRGSSHSASFTGSVNKGSAKIPISTRGGNVVYDVRPAKGSDKSLISTHPSGAVNILKPVENC